MHDDSGSLLLPRYFLLLAMAPNMHRGYVLTHRQDNGDPACYWPYPTRDGVMATALIV
jgi:hypothetical protein